jgi:hypothetical protein
LNSNWPGTSTARDRSRSNRNVSLDGVPDGYRAMNDRESIKAMVTL